ncbi:hypothetical protein ACSU1N_01290 [Thermogladius sp. 4427co]|uniref:hypothetical protein n=1 Tax=Thermogladius sp. 4427co TaxID=3450718 RepID=UPI003F7A55AE
MAPTDIHRINVNSTLVEVDDKRFNAVQFSIKSSGDFIIELAPGSFKFNGTAPGELKVVDEGDLITIESIELPLVTRIEREDFIIEDNVVYGYSKPLIMSVNADKHVLVKLNYKYSFKASSITVKIENGRIYLNAILSPFLSAWLYIDEGVVYMEREFTGINIAVSSRQPRKETISRQEGFQPSLA